MTMLRLLLPTLSLLSTATAAFIDNTSPRRDIHGDLMDLHDGNLERWSHEDDLFYWYGMGYGDCELEKGLIPPYNCPGIYQPFGHCGFRTDHSLNLYTSPDLNNWTFVGDVFPVSDRPEGIYFRPKVIYNKHTSEYVLWINYLAPAISPLASYPSAVLMVATSSSPSGPFTIVEHKANIGVSGGGDFNLMIDPKDDTNAYIAYDAWGNNHAVVVEQLTPSYHDSLGDLASSGAISPVSNEAPILFSRSGWYYLLYGHTCCFCEQGSGAEVWVAEHPLGPWTSMHLDINPRVVGLGERTVKAQCNYVITVKHKDREDEYLYTGDLWSSSPDGLKSHDLQYWSPPLQFDDQVSPPAIKPMEFVDSFTIEVE